MKNLVLAFVMAVVTTALLSSCGPDCKTCTGESVVVSMGDTVTSTVTGVELCDEALTAAESGPVTTSSTVNGTTIETTITYTCD